MGKTLTWAHSNPARQILWIWRTQKTYSFQRPVTATNPLSESYHNEIGMVFLSSMQSEIVFLPCRYLPIQWCSRSQPDGIDSQAGKKCQRCPSDDHHIYCPYTHVALDHLEATQPKPNNKATNNCQQLRGIDTNSRPAILLVVATIHFISLNLTVSCHLFRQMYWCDCIWRFVPPL